MTTETKKPPDFSQTAVNLCNPSEVYELLTRLHEEQRNLEQQKLELRAKQENLVTQIEMTEQVIASLQKDIKQAIETYGSFQNPELGYYGVKYQKMIRSYHVDPFKLRYAKYVPAMVEESINVKALEGLIKGGLITEADLSHPDVGVITETPQYAFYVR